MEEQLYWLVLGVLSVWRVTHLLAAEDGPWSFIAKLRQSIGNGFLGKLLDCFYCLSLWISVPFAAWIGKSWKERIFLWLGFSAGAILLERITNSKLDAAPPAIYFEHGGEENALLRSGTDATRSTTA